MTVLGKNSAIFCKFGKVYLLNWDFLLIGNVPGELGIFSANWEKNWYQKPDPVLYREKALLLTKVKLPRSTYLGLLPMSTYLGLLTKVYLPRSTYLSLSN